MFSTMRLPSIWACNTAAVSASRLVDSQAPVGLLWVHAKRYVDGDCEVDPTAAGEVVDQSLWIRRLVRCRVRSVFALR
jgi:hypothetical protein